MPPSPEAAHPNRPRRPGGRGRAASDYLPLAVLVAVAFVAALAIQAAFGRWDARAWMLRGMGLFLIFISLLKFVDLPGFVEGFRRYDLVAQRLRAYGYLYPFIEFGLGLGYLAQGHLPWLFGLTIGVMLLGIAGVLRGLAQGLDVDCACMGTVLHVPLSTVTLTEDAAMAAMAAVMWLAPS
jgi:hypothetical protein